jgi:hypothetical protein
MCAISNPSPRTRNASALNACSNGDQNGRLRPTLIRFSFCPSSRVGSAGVPRAAVGRSDQLDRMRTAVEVTLVVEQVRLMCVLTVRVPRAAAQQIRETISDTSAVETHAEAGDVNARRCDSAESFAVKARIDSHDVTDGGRICGLSNHAKQETKLCSYLPCHCPAESKRFALTSRACISRSFCASMRRVLTANDAKAHAREH